MADTLQQAFVEAWNECGNPELDSENPHFHKKFASLKATLAEVRKACKAHGIAYSQRLVSLDGRAELRSSVVGMGESIDLSAFPVECPPNPQSFGSNLTYAKRQQAQADWGITGETDDDAEAAAAFQRGFSGQQRPAQAPAVQMPAAPAAAPQSAPLGTDPAAAAARRKKMLARCAELSAKCIENGMNPGATEGFMKAKFKVEELPQLSDEQLLEFGRYLAEMEEQSRNLKKEEEE